MRGVTADLPAPQPHTHTPLGLITTNAGPSGSPGLFPGHLVLLGLLNRINSRGRVFPAAPDATVPAWGRRTRGFTE